MVTPTPPHLRGLLIAQLWELGEVIRVGGDGDLDPIMLSLALYDIHINKHLDSITLGLHPGVKYLLSANILISTFLKDSGST